MVFLKGRRAEMSRYEIEWELNDNDIFDIVSIFDRGYNSYRRCQECLIYLRFPSFVTNNILAAGPNGLIYPFKNNPGSINFIIEKARFSHWAYAPEL